MQMRQQLYAEHMSGVERTDTMQSATGPKHTSLRTQSKLTGKKERRTEAQSPTAHKHPFSLSFSLSRTHTVAAVSCGANGS